MRILQLRSLLFKAILLFSERDNLVVELVVFGFQLVVFFLDFFKRFLFFLSVF